MIKFVKMRLEHQEMVLKWRLQPEVSESMFTRVENDLQKQIAWFHRINAAEDMKYWIAYFDDTPVGVINIVAWDKLNQRCNAGYYVGNLAYLQLGAMILPYFYNYIFKELKIHKIYGEVIQHNDRIMSIHKLHGYRHVGTFTDHVFKDGRFYDVHLVELMASTWLSMPRYAKQIAPFEDS